MKKCYKCLETKEKKFFHKQKSAKDGLHSMCKECRKKYDGTPEQLERRRLNAIKYRKMFPNSHKEYYKKVQESKPNISLWKNAKKRAKEKNLIFTITVEDVVIPEKCPVLGIDIKTNKNGFRWNSPSLDRINPEKGYTKENIAVISYRANVIKNCGTIEEHKKIIKYMEKHENNSL